MTKSKSMERPQWLESEEQWYVERWVGEGENARLRYGWGDTPKEAEAAYQRDIERGIRVAEIHARLNRRVT